MKVGEIKRYDEMEKIAQASRALRWNLKVLRGPGERDWRKGKVNKRSRTSLLLYHLGASRRSRLYRYSLILKSAGESWFRGGVESLKVTGPAS